MSGPTNAFRPFLAKSIRCNQLTRRFLPNNNGAHQKDFFMRAHSIRYSSATALRDSYDHIKVEKRNQMKDDGSSSEKVAVGLITLHRPKALNALSLALLDDLVHASKALSSDESIGCLVLTGSEKAFAAGADIAEMSTQSFADVYKSNMFAIGDEISALRIPTIAAVNGYALGGGCELAMMCDIIFAGSKAKFGQPEINLGVMPGLGGTQRLVRAIGKSKAMDMVLTGRHVTAEQAEKDGLVARIFPAEELVEESVKVGLEIASKGRMAAMMCKEAVNATDEMTLREGLHFERRLFHSLFATKDQKEGMAAFLGKRKPDFSNE